MKISTTSQVPAATVSVSFTQEEAASLLRHVNANTQSVAVYMPTLSDEMNLWTLSEALRGKLFSAKIHNDPSAEVTVKLTHSELAKLLAATEQFTGLAMVKETDSLKREAVYAAAQPLLSKLHTAMR